MSKRTLDYEDLDEHTDTTTVTESNQIRTLRVLILRAVERAFESLPANSSPEYFSKKLSEEYSELIHDFTAQTFVNIRENIIVSVNKRNQYLLLYWNSDGDLEEALAQSIFGIVYFLFIIILLH